MAINGQRHSLWRAVDHVGEVLEAVVPTRRNKPTAREFPRKLMRRYGHAEEIVTDRFTSDRTALRDLGATDKQQTRRWLNNRVENSHLPLRQRKRHVTLPVDAKSPEVRRRPLLRLEPLQPGTIPQQPRELQRDPYRRTCRVARIWRGIRDRGTVLAETGLHSPDSTRSGVCNKRIAAARTVRSKRSQSAHDLILDWFEGAAIA